jgi:hypothetical protein
MTSESERSTPENREMLRLNLLELLRVDFEDAKKLEMQYFPNYVFIQLDPVDDENIPVKTILLTEKGEKVGISSLKTTDRYYVSTVDEDVFPTGGHPEHSGLESILVRHINDSGSERVFSVSFGGFQENSSDAKNTLRKLLPTKADQPEEDVLEELRTVLTDYRPTPFPSVEE